jgi:hypothetical protein
MEMMAAMFASTAAAGTLATSATIGAAVTGTGAGVAGLGASTAAGSLAATIGAGGSTLGAGGLLASAGFGVGDLISGAFTGISALSDIQSGRAEAAQLKALSELQGVQATQEELQGRKDALNATMQLNDVLSSNLAASFGSGLKSSGSVAQASEDATKDADFAIDLTRDAAKARAMAKKGQAAITKAKAGSAKRKGVTDAVGKVVGFGKRVIEREGGLFDID